MLSVNFLIIPRSLALVHLSRLGSIAGSVVCLTPLPSPHAVPTLRGGRVLVTLRAQRLARRVGCIRYSNKWINSNVAGESTLDSGAGKTSLKDGTKTGI